jgi:hypothetical protein
MRLAFTGISLLWPKSDKPVHVPVEQDQISRSLIEAAAKNQIEIVSHLLSPQTFVQAPSGTLEKMVGLLQQNGSLQEIFPIGQIELKGNAFGKSVHRESSLTYAIKTEKDFVYEAWLKLDLETNPISVSAVRFQPLGFVSDVRAFTPSGTNSSSGSAWFVNGLVLLFAAVLITVWVLAFKKIWNSSLRHRWLWALLLFVNIIPIQLFLASGGYKLGFNINAFSFPVQIFSTTTFYPHILLLQIPVGALFLLYKFRKQTVK